MPESGQQDMELSNRNNPSGSVEAASSGLVSVKPPGLYFPWPFIAAILVGTAVVFTGSILATYYGKTCPDCSKVDLEIECRNYYCNDQTVIECKTNKSSM